MERTLSFERENKVSGMLAGIYFADVNGWDKWGSAGRSYSGKVFTSLKNTNNSKRKKLKLHSSQLDAILNEMLQSCSST